ncbi:MAG: hypothetical protein Q4D65_04375 [Peptostreptococcaceae bacterium]|nr:hypothetical protein [Peptostreptococcaceae bacterium]
MKKTVRAGILFILLICLVITLPTLRRIHHLQKSIGQSNSVLSTNRGISLFAADSYDINRDIERMIQEAKLQKKSLFFHTEKFEQIKLYEYELNLFGKYEDIAVFVEKISAMQGIKIRELDLNQEETSCQLQMKAVFVSE